MEYQNHQGPYRVLYIIFESSQASREDVAQKIAAIGRFVWGAGHSGLPDPQQHEKGLGHQRKRLQHRG